MILCGFLAILIGLMNQIGGRFADILPGKKINGRLIFRCILPGIYAGLFSLAYGFPWVNALWDGVAVMAGSALWFSPGWSFDEISGEYDMHKYPGFIQSIGLGFFPYDSLPATNKKRAIIMKGMRGMFDIGTFSLLSIFHHHALAYFPLTASMGLIYYLAGRLRPGAQAVLVAETAYGDIRGLLIALAISI